MIVMMVTIDPAGKRRSSNRQIQGRAGILLMQHPTKLRVAQCILGESTRRLTFSGRSLQRKVHRLVAKLTNNHDLLRIDDDIALCGLVQQIHCDQMGLFIVNQFRLEVGALKLNRVP